MSNNKCIYCSQDKGNASIMCGGTDSHRHSYPKPDTVTISREDLSALLLNYEWFLTRFEGAMDFDPRVVSGKLTKALEVQGE